MTTRNEQQGLLPRRPLLRRAIDSLFGYDFFVSYRWQDGRVYAVALTEALAKGKYTCFLDSSDFRVGDIWTVAVEQALKKSSVLILVGTQGALTSQPVAKEIKLFCKFQRAIFPIDIGGALAGAPESDLVQSIGGPHALRASENPSRQTAGPSDDVLQSLRNSFKMTKQNTKRTRMLASAAVGFAIVAMLALWFGFAESYARQEADEQTIKAKKAKLEADRQRSLALRQRNLAVAQKLAILAPNVGTTFRQDDVAALVALHGYQFQQRAQLGGLAPIDKSLRSVLNRQMFCQTLKAHKDPVSAVAVSPDRQLVATASMTGEVAVFDLGKRPTVRTVFAGPKESLPQTDPAASAVVTVGISAGPLGPLTVLTRLVVIEDAEEQADRPVRVRLRFSSDSKTLFAHQSGRTAVWDTASGRELSLPRPVLTAPMADFASGVDRIVTGDGSRLTLWMRENGVFVSGANGKAEELPVRLAVAPDGSHLAGITRDDAVWVWDTGDSFNNPRKVRQASSNVLVDSGPGVIEFSQDGAHLFASGAAAPQESKVMAFGRISLWDTKALTARPREFPETAVTGISLTPDGQWLVVASNSDSLFDQMRGLGSSLPRNTAVFRVFDTHKPLSRPIVVGGEEAGVTAVTHSHDGRWLVTGNWSGSVRLWEWEYTTANETIAQIADAHLEELPPAGAIVQLGSDEVLVCDDRSCRVVPFRPRANTQSHVVFWNDGAKNGGNENPKPGELRRVDFSAGGRVQLFPSKSPPTQNESFTLALMPRTPGGTVYSLAAGKSRDIVAVGCMLGTAVWDRKYGNWKGLAEGGDKVTCVSISGDSGTLASVDFGHLLRVWTDIDRPPHVFHGPQSWLGVAVRPDGRQFATVDVGGRVALWDLGGGNPQPVFLKDQPRSTNSSRLAGGRCVVYSADCRRLATAGRDYGVAIWDVHGQPRLEKVLAGSTEVVTAIGFDPAGAKVAAGSRDGYVRLWDLSTTEDDPLELAHHPGGIVDVQFSLDGRHLLTLGADQQVRRCPATTSQLAEMVRDKVRRNLTVEEWRRYVGADFDYERALKDLPDAP